MIAEPSTKPLVTALMLALGRAAELYDQCRKDENYKETVTYWQVRDAHTKLKELLDQFDDVPEDSRPILAAYETVTGAAKSFHASNIDDALALLGLDTK